MKPEKDSFQRLQYSYGTYEDYGLTKMSKNPYKLIEMCDARIAQMEFWIKNWKALKQDCKKNILNLFTKDELKQFLEEQ